MLNIRTLLLFALCLLLQEVILSQSFEVIYKVRDKPKKHSKKFLEDNPGLVPILDEIAKAQAAFFLEFKLIHAASKSLYYCIDKEKQPAVVEFAEGKVKATIDIKEDTYYKDLKSCTFQSEYINMNGHFKIKDELHRINWRILPEQRIILNYPCQKAEATFNGQKIDAWFSSIIPIQNGPCEFGGLPGLILRLENEHNSYTVIDLKQINGETKELLPIFNKKDKSFLTIAEYYDMKYPDK